MGRRNDLIQSYARDLRDKCGITPDMDLLERVAIGCGPAIYDQDAAVVSAGDPDERARIRENFLVQKLDLRDGPHLDDAIEEMIDAYGRSEPTKQRAVLYYMLVRHFGREEAFL